MNRRAIALAALASASLLFAACGDDDAGSETSAGGHGSDGHDDGATAVADGAREVEVRATIQAFDPEEITAEVGEDLAIVLTSEDMLHDFTIDELDVHVAADARETSTGGLSADEPGTYTYYCSVPGHRSAGMQGTLTVE